jgi:hypothetical protein
MRRHLVLARVGAGSLHRQWLSDDAQRGWDLRLVPFQPIGEQPVGVAVEEIVPGPKWTGLGEVLRRWDGWRGYDYIWLPDDDLLTDARTIDRMFAAAEAAGLDLFAPALDEDSYFAHFDTMRNRSFHGRWVGFVEIMCPGFSRAALERLQFTLELSDTGWGWGLDSVWPKLLGYRNVGMLDGAAVTHTRPVGAMRDEALRRRVLAESDRLLATYACRQRHTTFGAFDADGNRVRLSPDELRAGLLDGWRYLIDREPVIQDWIEAFQDGGERCVEYPAAGTPGGGPRIDSPQPVAR